MKNKLYLFLTGLLVSCILTAGAQDTTHCNAGFNVQVLGTTASFSAVDSLDSTITHYWNFGDTTALVPTSSPFITHVYAHAGTYRVLQIIQGPHCFDSVSKLVVVDSTPPPVSCSISVLITPDSVHGKHFYNLYSYPFVSQGVVDTVFWFVNDSLIGIGQNITGHYFDSGSYSICARLTTSSGCTSQACQQLSDSASPPPVDSVPPPPPPPSCTLGITVLRDPLQSNKVTFSISDSAGIYDSVQWHGFRIQDSLQLPVYLGNPYTHIFTDSGCYFIWATAVRNSWITGMYDYNSRVCSASTSICIDSLPAAPDNSIAAYPNPVYDQTILYLTLAHDEKVEIDIFNSMGRLVQTSRVAGSKGDNRFVVPMRGLTTGIYYIQVKYGDTTKKSKIQKL